jgi:formylmethanofuran dehydrogenase subunit E
VTHVKRLVLVLVLVLVGCGGSPPGEPRAPMTPARMDEHTHTHSSSSNTTTPAVDPIEQKLDEVARIHGEAGPWAVLGYRMSEHAMEKLGLARGSFDLSVVHWSPKEVRYACIADGAAAHSGASLGKLNLSLVEASSENVLTVYRDKKSGRTIALRPTASFQKRYTDVPQGKARALGREVLSLPREDLFEEVSVAGVGTPR